MAQGDRAARGTGARVAVPVEAFEHGGVAEPRRHFGRGRIELEPPLLDELHRGSGGDRLGHRRDPAYRVRGHLLPAPRAPARRTRRGRGPRPGSSRRRRPPGSAPVDTDSPSTASALSFMDIVPASRSRISSSGGSPGLDSTPRAAGTGRPTMRRVQPCRLSPITHTRRKPSPVDETGVSPPLLIV